MTQPLKKAHRKVEITSESLEERLKGLIEQQQEDHDFLEQTKEVINQVHAQVQKQEHKVTRLKSTVEEDGKRLCKAEQQILINAQGNENNFKDVNKIFDQRILNDTAMLAKQMHEAFNLRFAEFEKNFPATICQHTVPLIEQNIVGIQTTLNMMQVRVQEMAAPDEASGTSRSRRSSVTCRPSAPRKATPSLRRSTT